MPKSSSLAPSLDHARARVRRAGDHVDELESEIRGLAERFRTGETSKLAVSLSGSGWVEDVTGSAAVSEIDPHALVRIGILIGETVYNLRAALDYLIFELAFLDSKRFQRDTKFPAADSEKAWRRLTWKSGRVMCLRGLGRKHKAKVRRFQPDRGAEWLLDLTSLSNSDKHRKIRLIDDKADSLIVHVGGEDGYMPPVASRSSAGMAEKVSLTIAVRSRTLPLVETLCLLQEQVADVVEAFAEDFP